MSKMIFTLTRIDNQNVETKATIEIGRDDLDLDEMRDAFGSLMLAMSWMPDQVKQLFNDEN